MTSDSDSVQRRISDFWSTIASDYEGHGGNVAPLGTPEYEAWVDAIRAALPPTPSEVLDVGTGTGFVALIAAALGHRVTGIDLAPGMLDVARAEAERRGLRVAFVMRDAVGTDFPAQSFDAITSRHFLWTLREPEKAFANWKRLLRPNGRLIAIDALWFSADDPEEETPSSEEPGIFERHYTAETKAALPLMRARTLGALIAMIERAGFQDIEFTDLAWAALKDDRDLAVRTPYLLTARRS